MADKLPVSSFRVLQFAHLPVQSTSCAPVEGKLQTGRPRAKGNGRQGTGMRTCRFPSLRPALVPLVPEAKLEAMRKIAMVSKTFATWLFSGGKNRKTIPGLGLGRVPPAPDVQE